jgi:hypothetical protein
MQYNMGMMNWPGENYRDKFWKPTEFDISRRLDAANSEEEGSEGESKGSEGESKVPESESEAANNTTNSVANTTSSVANTTSSVAEVRLDTPPDSEINRNGEFKFVAHPKRKLNAISAEREWEENRAQTFERTKNK